MASRGGTNTVAFLGFKSGSTSFTVENVIEGANADVDIVGLTVDGYIYRSLQPFLISAIEVLDGVENGYVISARRSGLDGYSPNTKGKLGVFTSLNLANDYLWEANGGDNRPAGWSVTDITSSNTLSFSGGTLQASLGETTTNPQIYKDYFAPFVGQTVTVNITALNTNAGAQLTSDDFTCKIDALDASGSVLSTIDSNFYQESDPSQDITLTGVIPASTATLRVYLLDVTSAITNTNDIDFNQPTINITY